MEEITSSSVSGLILAYPLLVDKIPLATPTSTRSFSHWVGLQPPSTHNEPWCQGARAAQGVALTLSDPLTFHLYDSHVPRRQAQRVMHNPLHHHYRTQGPSVQVRHPQVSPQVCCNVTLALSTRPPTFVLSLPFLDHHTARLQV